MMDVQRVADKMSSYNIDMKNASEDNINEIEPINITIKPMHTVRRGFFSGMAYGVAHMVNRAFNSRKSATAIRPIGNDGRPIR